MFQPFGVRTSDPLAWYQEPRSTHSLKTVGEHGTVHLLQQVWGHLHDEVRTDPKDVRVIRRVVNLAE